MTLIPPTGKKCPQNHDFGRQYDQEFTVQEFQLHHGKIDFKPVKWDFSLWLLLFIDTTVLCASFSVLKNIVYEYINGNKNS